MEDEQLTTQPPAVGILKKDSWGDSMHYYVQCDCTDDDDAHDVEIEADDHGVCVHIYVNVHTKWWHTNRWKQIWELLTTGQVQMQTTIILKEQAAHNYAETLKQAIRDVKEFKVGAGVRL